MAYRQEEESDKLLKTLMESLPVIARVSCGPAAVTDKQGRRIRTCDSNGKIIFPDDAVLDVAQLAGETGKPQLGHSQIVDGAEVWAVPFGNYVLAACNADFILRNNVLFDSLKEALPMISRVVGGEAVLFDNHGRRLYSVDYDGKTNEAFIGKISAAAQKAMATGKPFIGDSLSVMGATAVRIPINRWLGIGLNNEQSIKYKRKLYSEVQKYQSAKYTFDDIIGSSQVMSNLKHTVRSISKSASSVLLMGETGTGKELFAQAIHNESDRRGQPFIAINCGAMPESLIESYLFGYVEGSFTGAKKTGAAGAFEQANGGTLFLDELGEMNLDLQKKLLRVLQERVVTRIGSQKLIPLDVRIVASTNRDLRAMIREKTFREDLYFRLSVMEFTLPPLRERREDIPDLIDFYIKYYNKILGLRVAGADDNFYQLAQRYNWPGNVRELQNYVEYAMNLAQPEDEYLRWELLPQRVKSRSYDDLLAGEPIRQPEGARAYREPERLLSAPAAGRKSPERTEAGPEEERLRVYRSSGEREADPADEDKDSRFLRNSLDQAERNTIIEALSKTGGSKKECAELLNISTTTLWRKMKRLGIVDEKRWK